MGYTTEIAVYCPGPSLSAKITPGVLVIVRKKNTDAVPVTDELHLRQLTVDEALLKLDKYLDDAFMAGLYQVKVIHGKGTGTLRQVVREQLIKHPLVKSYRPGEYGEGEAGVTIVELAPK